MELQGQSVIGLKVIVHRETTPLIVTQPNRFYNSELSAKCRRTRLVGWVYNISYILVWFLIHMYMW